MNEDYIKEILNKLMSGEANREEALEALRDLPYKSLGFANVDHHRAIRTGFPEVVFCQGKTPEQVRDILVELSGRGQAVMATRATPNDYNAVTEAIPDAVFYEEARIISVPSAKAPDIAGSKTASVGTVAEDAANPETIGTIAIVTAGTADIPVAEEAAVAAELMGNSVMRIYDVGVAGIHRLFDRLDDIRKADVVIVIAGMEGALASVVGGLVDTPVIAVPTSVGYGSNFEGLSALLSMMNSCANGVTVVNIDNGFGAAYAAAVINSSVHRNR